MGANHISGSPFAQHHAYGRAFHALLNIGYSDNKGLRLISGKSAAIGSKIVRIPVDEL